MSHSIEQRINALQQHPEFTNFTIQLMPPQRRVAVTKCPDEDAHYSTIVMRPAQWIARIGDMEESGETIETALNNIETRVMEHEYMQLEQYIAKDAQEIEQYNDQLIDLRADQRNINSRIANIDSMRSTATANIEHKQQRLIAMRKDIHDRHQRQDSAEQA